MEKAIRAVSALERSIVSRAFALHTAEREQALHDATALTERYLGPFITKIAVDMLGDLLAAVRRDPGAVVVFQGRDGFVFGHAVAALSPDFFAAHCVPMYLSRALVQSALCALEERTDAVFTGLGSFRSRVPDGAPSRAAWAELTAYFLRSGVPIGAPGSVIHLVDTGLKGSIQEMLSALYPQTVFHGHLAFHAAGADDPHPGSKRGYVLHLDGPDSGSGAALRGALPSDRAMTFHHRHAILAVERLVQGSHCSPERFGPNGQPFAPRARHDPAPTRDIDPSRIVPPYGEPRLREGVRSMVTLGICRYAAALAERITSDPEWLDTAAESAWYAELEQRGDEFADEIRLWVRAEADGDRRLRTLLDAFVPRN